VATFDDHGAAERARDELIARGHHQHYWLTSSADDHDQAEDHL
jgi:DNA-binding LacI/PurR family transcriptional regulator